MSATSTQLSFGDYKIAHTDYRKLIVVGAGKACAGMAAGMETSLGEAFLDRKNVSGWVNVPDDQAAELKRIKLFGCRPAGINLPTDRVLVGTQKIIEIVSQCHPDDLCVVLIAGGGSALLEQPMPPISLADFRTVTQLLSHGGASITELNIVRRRISCVKGGGLARLANCHRMITLLISDVIGDRLDVIASGPTLYEDSTQSISNPNADALAVLSKYDPGLSRIPAAVLEVLEQSKRKNQSTSSVTHVHHLVIANLERAVQSAQREAIKRGYLCETEIDDSSDRVDVVARRLIQPLLSIAKPEIRHPPRCFISGGEPTVELCPTPGRGGRNQQLVLSAMLRILESDLIGDRPFSFLSGGTDGEDGNVPVAGGMIDSNLVEMIQSTPSSQAILNQIQQSLLRNDAYPLLENLNCLYDPGPTNTNVCDLRVLVHE